ncbi:hypothetical protein B0H10DRAFT_1956129 [Mycena sp. CBHHK59/15]|nr:hypothetical protein B0H10DRAFT_1956129 [Mycena sp. CBHHK59/15]
MQGAFVYNWGLPGINIDPPPVREGYVFTSVPSPLPSLRFSPLGLYDLRRHLGVLKCQPSIFNQNKPRFLVSDIAWFAGGASTDGRHLTDGFFPEFDDLRQMLPVGAVGGEARKSLNLKMQHVVFDLATLWDRSFGGSTIVLHMEGTTVPNTPVLPEYLRCTAYLPPLFLADNPASHGPIAQIAQTFIESVGVPTVNKWFSNARARGWPLSQSGPHPRPNPTSSTLIPAPNGADSAHYKFLGRPIGALNEILGTRPSPPPLFVIPDDDVEDLLERLGDAEGRSNEHLTQIQALEEQAEMLISQVVALETALAAERQSNTTLRNALNAPTHSTPATPSRSQPAPSSARTPATPRSPSTPTRHHPPPYSPSGVPPRLTPFAPSPSRFAPDHTDLDAFLTSHGLDNQADAINMLLRVAHPVKCAEELTQLGVPDDLVSLVLDVMSMQ